MKNRFFIFFLFLAASYLAAGCEDSGGLTTSAPNIDVWAVGDVDSPRPEGDKFSEVPEGDRLALDFGVVDVDTTKYQYLFFHNGGRSALKLSRVEWMQGSSADFNVSCLSSVGFVNCPQAGSDPLDVDAGDDLVVRVGYKPIDIGPDSGSFLVVTNSEKHAQITVELTGTGAASEIRVCISDCTGDQSGAACASAADICNDQAAPANLAIVYGETDLDTAVSRRVRIFNLGDWPLQISGLGFGTGDFNQFRLDKRGQQLPGVLQAGTQAEIDVIYDPGTGGEHSSTLRVLSNDVNEREIVVELNGKALAPRVCPEPMFLDFGNVATGEVSPKSFKITNCGLLELNLMDLQMHPGSSPDFSLINRPTLPRMLQPGESVDVPVQYAPLESGTDSGGVDIYSNDPNSQANHYTGTVQLAGRSIPRACDIQATPFAVMFGGVVQNATQTVDLIVSNQGTDTCMLIDAVITTNSADGEFAIVQKPDPNTEFNPGDTLLITLSYTPKNLGTDTGVLTLYGNDKDTSEIRVDLNGQGVEDSVCDIAIQPTTQQYGMVKVNNTKPATITLTNRGQQTCRITRLQLKQSMMTPGDITITRAPQVPFTLDRQGTPNASVAVEVTFAPSHPGTHKSYLWLDSNDPDLKLGGLDCLYNNNMQPIPLGTACVPISGSADEGVITAVPSELDFGVVTVGCASPELTVTLYNLGGIAINISRIYLDPSNSPFQIRSAPNTPYTLNGGASVQLKLRYVPRSTVTDRATLYVECDASNTQLLAVPLYGRGTNITDQTDIFHQPSQVESDILFVVDNSGSMTEEQSALTSNFSAFINYAITLNVSFQIGVIATEVNDAESGLGDPRRDVFPGVLVQAPGRPKIITNSTPDIPGAFRDNATLGTCCSDEQEAGLEAAWMALSPGYIDDPAKNLGFLREDAKLYIIILSDEQDQSQGKPDFYVDFFRSIKGYRNRERMKVSVIVGDEPDGCGNGLAESGSRYIEVANQTGGIFVSICNNNWAQNLQSLGIDAFAAIREFPLSRQADPSTITVTVDGRSVGKSSSGNCDTCTNGWVYYGDTNTICFCSNDVPGRGARIEVHYTAVCITP